MVVSVTSGEVPMKTAGFLIDVDEMFVSMSNKERRKVKKGRIDLLSDIIGLVKTYAWLKSTYI